MPEAEETGEASGKQKQTSEHDEADQLTSTAAFPILCPCRGAGRAPLFVEIIWAETRRADRVRASGRVSRICPRSRGRGGVAGASIARKLALAGKGTESSELGRRSPR